MSSRKRRAPGASPRVQHQSNLQNNIYPQDTSNISADQYLNNWNDPSATVDMNTSFNDPSLFDGISYSGHLGDAAGQPTNNRIVSLEGLSDTALNAVPNYSSQLVRRNPNQQLAARGRTPWDAFNGSSGQQSGWENTDDDEELEQKAMVAKKDALSKRKQIPPFVQKLSSFLDEKNNTNLIRWSDDGNSFIVLDEDEFARTLIPELFKHNNYASFVRQLNMYGFHKKVGLSDNSMKASEQKAKAPSEYFNKYFKRGRPELLWLIQKPKNPGSNPKRKRDDDGKQGDSDDERKYVADAGGGGAYGEDGVAVRGIQDMAMIPRTEYNSLRSEVRALQQQQKIISNVLNQIRQQNDQLYRQATAFQTLHDRHENSINAILTFLATFYNRSLEGNNGANIADMFGPTIPQQQTHGNVVDVGDYPEKNLNKSPQLHRPARRPLALLPAPAPKDAAAPSDRAATISPSIRSTASTISKPTSRQSVFKSPAQSRNTPQGSKAFSNQPAPEGNPMGPLKVDTDSPQNLAQIPENDEVMSAIQNVNANASQATSQGPQFDFPAALTHYETADGNVPLTPQQRNDVLSLMANTTGAASPNSTLAQTNNALVSPQPPSIPSLDQFVATQAQLDILQKMSSEQSDRVHNLQERLQPLSPSGTIPGLTDSNYFGDPGTYDLDLDSFVQGDDWVPPDQNGGTGAADVDVTLPDLNYQLPDTTQDLESGAGEDDFSGVGFDGANDAMERGGTIENVDSTAPSPATVEDGGEETKRSPKRRKK
ncbi:hypothetical protein K469DRAFT_691853 [Zopfia rhizophila CBS 207.26]|uniref:HSF-type DNA-binding domain-containing protein n=1 Tax=Zopfia rhizophila CBS 207.26 TaxID=1314779 RepID=A0A6A6DUE7_9PEZI|nr:hypothetical protein K469DRAFT_691853 [Zopfia rhizophila CBS 207.26]